MNILARLMILAGVAVSAGGCGGVPSEVRFPPGVDIPWKSVCTYDNCGASGKLVVHPRSNTPSFLGGPLTELLGLKYDTKSGGAPQACSAPIKAGDYNKTFSQDTAVTVATNASSEFATNLKLGFKVALSDAYGTVKVDLDAAIDKAVSETISGKYDVAARAYTLKPDVFAARKKADVCGDQTEHAAIIYSVSIVTISGAAQSAIAKRLKEAIDISGKLKGPIASADTALAARNTTALDLAMQTAVEATSIVVSYGFDF